MSITLDQVTKRYAGAPVVNDVSLDIGDGEFFVLLGPSGSGKSTLLRAIAGLSGVDHGRIALHGRDVTHVAARKRGVGLVFQNYALFGHMTVADRIGIMNLGRLLELGAPHDLYSRPATRFVATFLGAANLILARRTPDGIQMGANTVAAAESSPGVNEHEVVAVVRPEEVEVAASRDGLSSGYFARGVVHEVVFTGALESLRVRLEDGAQAPLLAQADGEASASLL